MFTAAVNLRLSLLYPVHCVNFIPLIDFSPVSSSTKWEKLSFTGYFFCPDSNLVKITFLTHIPYSGNCVLFQIEQRICVFAPFLLSQWHQSTLSKFQFFLYPLRRASNIARLTIVCSNYSSTPSSSVCWSILMISSNVAILTPWNTPGPLNQISSFKEVMTELSAVWL